MTKREIPVDEFLSRACRKELELKKSGAYAEAAGVRDAVVLALRLADEEVPPIEPEDEE
jgi:hypothetical protein